MGVEVGEEQEFLESLITGGSPTQSHPGLGFTGLTG